MTQSYILISMIALTVIAVLLAFVAKGGYRQSHALTPLAGVAFGFILVGITFGDDRLLSYGFMGVGVAVAIVDIVRKQRRT